MASYTPNYNLKKPAGTDVVDIDDLNGNMDIIDTQLNSLNSNITGLLGTPTSTYNADLNNLLTPGWYLLGSNATNVPPVQSGGKLKVEYGDRQDYVRQTYYGGYAYTIYTRTRFYYQSQWQWTAWQEVTNDTINSKLVKYGTYSTDALGALVGFPKADYIVLSVSKEDNVIIPYTSPSNTKWLVRRTSDNTAFASQDNITVAYISK